MIAWWDPPAEGATNMALDEALAAEAARLDRVLVRISTWSEPTLSLGAFQAIAEARAHRALAGLRIVRRPSGGGAILHGSDVTLSVAVPRLHPCGGTPQRLYDAVHEALVAELSACGVEAGLSAGGARAGRSGIDRVDPDSGPETPQAPGPPAEGPLLCFDRRAVGDVVMPVPDGRFGSDAKILGSAQRRLRGAVLQHGSLLLAANRLVPEESRHPGLEELQQLLARGFLIPGAVAPDRLNQGVHRAGAVFHGVQRHRQVNARGMVIGVGGQARFKFSKLRPRLTPF